MYSPIPLEEVIAALPIDEQEAIAKRGAELVAGVRRRLSLAELRKGAQSANPQIRQDFDKSVNSTRGFSHKR